MSKVYDCIIIGGGPAGLSAALYLGRLRRSALVIDDQEGRSTWHQVNRNYLGFPDGIHATALRELGRSQAHSYGIEFQDGRATGLSMAGEGRERRFTVTVRSGQYTGRTLILATGVTDHFPEFEGSEACIGRSIFWCIICDGYEAANKRIVVLGDSDRAAALALQLLVFTSEVTLVAGSTGWQFSEERLRSLRERGVELLATECVSFNCAVEGELRSLSLATGEEVQLDMLFVDQHIEPNTQLAKKLGIHTDEHGFVRTDAEQCTNVDGVFGAGDVTKLYNHQVTSAVHEGGMAAAAANYYLYENWQKD
jgi:thioredoxin reductase (NADPH)